MKNLGVWWFVTWTGCVPTTTPESVVADTAGNVVWESQSDGQTGEDAQDDPEQRIEHHQMAIVAGLAKDYTHGAISTVDLETWSIEDSIVPTSGDVVVRTSDDTVFVLNRLNTDTVQVFPGPLSEPDLDVGMPDLSNPQDAVICNDEYWVTLHNSSVIPRYNNLGLRVGETDISEWAGTDGHAEAASIIRDPDGTRIFVSLQRLKQDEGWVSDGGVVVTISCLDGAVTDVLEMGPSPSIAMGPTTDTLGYKTGLYGPLDGEIGSISPNTGERSVHVTETEVGGDIGAYAFFGHHLVYASSDPDWMFTVHCLNLNTGESSQMGSLNQYVSDISTDTHGRFWVSLRPGWAVATVDGVGVEILDPATCTSLIPSGQPLRFTLPPYNVAFR